MSQNQQGPSTRHTPPEPLSREFLRRLFETLLYRSMANQTLRLLHDDSKTVPTISYCMVYISGTIAYIDTFGENIAWDELWKTTIAESQGCAEEKKKVIIHVCQGPSELSWGIGLCIYTLNSSNGHETYFYQSRDALYERNDKIRCVLAVTSLSDRW